MFYFITFKMMKIILKLCLLGRKNLFDHMCQNINEWKQLLLYLYLWKSIFVNKNRILAANFMFAGIKSRVFVFALVLSSWVSPKIASKFCCVLCRVFLYSDSSLILSPCTSVSCQPRLVLLPRLDVTYTDLFLFFLFF